jgi:hypothetical protein
MNINSFFFPHGLMVPSFKRFHTIFTKYYLSYLLHCVYYKFDMHYLLFKLCEVFFRKIKIKISKLKIYGYIFLRTQDTILKCTMILPSFLLLFVLMNKWFEMVASPSLVELVSNIKSVEMLETHI